MAKAKADKSPSPSQAASERAKAWGPGIHTFPWLPFFVTVALIIFCAGVVLVLAISNGDNVRSWQIQPSVLLSLIASALGFCTAFIYGEGVRIGWWLFLMRGGTLKEVHERWEISSSPLKSVLYPLKRLTINRVVIGCLGSTAMFATGAFLQRASTVVPGIQVQRIHTSVPVAPELPYPFSSIYTGRTTTNDYLTTIFAKTLQQFQSRAPIAAINSTCDGSCTTNVPGAGFAVNCTDSTFNWTFIVDNNGDFSTKLGFQIDFNYTYDTYGDDGIPTLINPALMVDIRYKTLPITEGALYEYVVNSTTNFSTQVAGVYRQCVLRPATVIYPVLITANTTNDGSNTTTSTTSQSNNNTTNNNNILSLLGTIDTDPVIRIFKETYDSNDYTSGGSTYLAYVDTISALYSAEITIGNTGAAGWQVRRDLTSSPFGLFYIEGALGFDDVRDIDDGKELLVNTTFRDPTADVLSSMRELMFRMGVAAAADPTAGGVWAVEGFNTTNGPLDNQTSNPNDFVGPIVPIAPPSSYFSADGSLEAVQTTIITVYRTEYLYVALALAWVLLVVACVAPGFWGFWHLGRTVSLSPLEIARAFEAPLLSGARGGCGSNEPLEGIIAELGTKRVRYGEVVVEHGEVKEMEQEQGQQRVDALQRDKAQKTLSVSMTSVSNSSSNVNVPSAEKDAVVATDEPNKMNDNAAEAEPTETVSTALLSSTETTSRRPWLAVADADSVMEPRPGVLYD